MMGELARTKKGGGECRGQNSEYGHGSRPVGVGADCVFLFMCGPLRAQRGGGPLVGRGTDASGRVRPAAGGRAEGEKAVGAVLCPWTLFAASVSLAAGAVSGL